MASKFWPKGGLPGILHHYTETLTTFEYTSGTIAKPHSLLFIGGLGDGLATTSFMADIAKALQPTPWSLFTLNLSSSYAQWGTSHLDRDCDEIAECLRYIQAYKQSKYPHSKTILMGHSTGSQVVLHYLHKPNPHTTTPKFDPHLKHVKRPVLDGAVMQAPISDREAIQSVLQDGLGKRPASECQAAFRTIQEIAKDAAKRDQSIDILLPMALTSQIGYGTTPISCRRFMSLASPKSPQQPEEDDLFSSDLSDEQLSKTFGMIKERGLLRDQLVIFYSGADQAVPDWVDKEALLKRWKNAADHGGKEKIWDDEFTAIIPGASHALSNDDQAPARAFLCKRLMGYVQRIEQK
ncbi:uncharacterized protein EAE97_005695 [Botrytis byssoidea]|uniref:Uncharacterized protein n=1 Tax=Botrytis byssoidea TaxID=139641 RepID=A0A9P5IQQ4_9HELO|nr:uncharacterized protein EAE97_005695 [Botrytis byssoidea]KAF7943624.1 hypothetical protein EAE97_005695 [Botrytis byssoidea]